MKRFCYHTHTSFCDGTGVPEDFVKRALELNMKAVGFSSHTPLPFANSWSMEGSKFKTYCKEVEALKKKYQGQVDVYLALELDFIPNHSYSFSHMIQEGNLDYTIGAVHLVALSGKEGFWFLDGPDTNYSTGLKEIFEGDIQFAVTAYYKQVQQMLLEERPDVVAHLDKVKMNNKGRYFSEDESWYRELVMKTLDVIEQTRTIVEVNTRGIYKKKSKALFPDHFVLEECLRRNIPITISTDAHHIDELLGHFEETREHLCGLGFQSIWIFQRGEWVEESLC